MTNIVIGGLIEKDDKFLLVQEAKEKCKGKWNIPAGHLEVNESVIDCLKREIKEETGCDILQTGILEIGNKVLENEIRDFKLSGCHLDNNKKKRLEEISLRLSELSHKFSLNLLNATNLILSSISKQHWCI